MFSIIIKELKILVREKGSFFFLLIMPMLFIVLFGSVFGNESSTVTVNYMDQDGSKASKAFIRQVDKVDGFKVDKTKSTSLEQQVKEIKKGKLSSLLVIPKGFGEKVQSGKSPVNVKFYRDSSSEDSVSPIRAVLANISNGYHDRKLSAELMAVEKDATKVKKMMASPLQIRDIEENGKVGSPMAQFVPGYTVMFVFYIMITMVRRFFRERESGMIARLRSTPMKPLNYLIGMWVPALIMVLIQCTVLLTFGHVVYDLNLGDSLAIAAIVFCLAICGTGLGLALSLFVRGENQGLAFTQLIALGGAVIGGLWFPFDLLPSFAQVIGRFTPQYWAQKGFQDVMIRGAHLGDVEQTLGFLLIIGVAGLLLALVQFNRFLRSATS
ncbi:ABC-2 type transport system permease protein [Marininema mesophilum]|uniref:ABC-2 type transport system permease protein n=1 Tax=Marininema mesophilum TaxID=1048340 RepID=A0A1H2S8P9_9BACL|nr:ABC transporter permease [Marininema mesophilum]SDW27319.1 ABC-2 type transport system permease protein [Marininema mesophilum]